MAVKRTFLIVAAVLWIAAIALGITSYSTVNSGTYSYYQSEYNECLDGYLDCMSAYRTATYYKDSFLQLAQTYDVLMDSWEDKMEELEEEATMYGIGAGLCGTMAIVATIIGIVKRKNEPRIAVEVPAQPVDLPLEDNAATTTNIE